MTEHVEIDLQELFYLLRKKAWLIVVCACILGALALGYTAFCVPPQYRASVTMYVNNAATRTDSSYISASDLATAQQLVRTYVTIIESETVLEKVAAETGLNLSAKAIRNMMAAQSVEETEVFVVTITNPDPVMAAQIANAIATVAPAEISNILEGSSAKIIDYARVPSGRATPSYSKNTILGVAAGAAIALVIIVLQMVLDVRVKKEEDLKKICQVPVLGSIPEFTTVRKSGY